MSDLLTKLQDKTWVITLNRTDKHNAFDDVLLSKLQLTLDEAIANPAVRVILLKANGKHFCAGADLAWMQRMAKFNEQENFADAMVLAQVMKTLYDSPKPTIAVIQGSAFGGGAGLVAACDMAIAANNARFCFSEVKLGLIPAVISPYVVKAIGERAAKWLFMSAEIFNAEQAKQLNLVHCCVNEGELDAFAIHYAEKITQFAPLAVLECKRLVDEVNHKTIDSSLMERTAELIARKRVSTEGQIGLAAFLNKEAPNWN